MKLAFAKEREKERESEKEREKERGFLKRQDTRGIGKTLW